MGINITKRTSSHNTSYKAGRQLKFIVIHYTAGTTSRPGTAINTAAYFATTNRQASADFICDDANIVQYNPDIKNRYCWAVGGSKYSGTRGGSKYGICTNTNSISIEICSSNKKGKVTATNDANWYFTDAAVNNARELTKYLMSTYNIPASNVIRHWDVTGKACPGIAGWIIDAGSESKWNEFKTSLTGSSDATHGKIVNEDWIWKFLSSKGVNDYVVAGIMGNLYAESGLRTNNLQNTYESVLGMNDDKYTDAVDNGTYKNFANDGAGYGLCQWTYPTRKQGLLDYAKKTGRSIADLQVQGDWLWIELSRDYPGTLERIKKAETVDGASTVFLIEFERPANISDEVRKLRSSYGEAIYKRHHVESKPTATPTTNTFKPYTVKVTADSLNVRSGPGTGYGTTAKIKKGDVYTIIDESGGAGASKWGKLKSGAGWVSLDYCTKV